MVLKIMKNNKDRGIIFKLLTFIFIVFIPTVGVMVLSAIFPVVAISVVLLVLSVMFAIILFFEWCDFLDNF